MPRRITRVKIGLFLGSPFSLWFIVGCASIETYRPYLEEARGTVSAVAREVPAARASAELREAEELLREAEAAWKKGELSRVKELSWRAVERAKAGRLRAEVLVEVERVAALAKEASRKAELAESRIARIEAQVLSIERLAQEKALAALKPERPPAAPGPSFTKYVVKIRGYPLEDRRPLGDLRKPLSLAFDLRGQSRGHRERGEDQAWPDPPHPSGPA